MSQRDFQQTLRSPTCYPDLATTPISDDKDAYERVVTDAMAGDATLFARQDYVEEAWRIVDQLGAD